MRISASYICPKRGMAGLEPPEPVTVGRAAEVAKAIGLERLLIPVLEEGLLGMTRPKIAFLDGLVEALDQIDKAGSTVWFIAPAQRVLGLDWVAPQMVGGFRDPSAEPVFVDGKVRHLRRLDWWADPSLIQKRIKTFRELLSAVCGHPGLTGWLILDRALEWVRPEAREADWVLKSLLGEIRDQDERSAIYMGIGWQELLEPELVRALSKQVDGLRLSGLEAWPADFRKPTGGMGDFLAAAYLGTLSQWLMDRPTEVEVGWGLAETIEPPECMVEGGERLGQQALGGVNWLSLVDPDPGLREEPPWVTATGLEKVGLLDQGLEPKAWVEPCIEQMRAAASEEKAFDCIDVGAEEYMDDPQMHLSRLWNHFLQSE